MKPSLKPHVGIVAASLLLTACIEEPAKEAPASLESAQAALGVVPPSEVALWQKIGSSNLPDARYLAAMAFDEARKVLVAFGGISMNPSTGVVTPNQETWEWSPTTGKWTNRTGAGTAPNARSGAAMVYDSARGKLVLFGGRAGSGSDFEDTWEWDPSTGAWLDATAAGAHPSARSQHGMVYEKSTNRVLLFGGGRSDPNSYDGTGVTVSLGDTWEYDPANYTWTSRSTTSAPSVRSDFGLAWDSSRNKAVLFAGLQTDTALVAGVPKQDIWEWDPAAATWTERTAAGNKPSQRFAHAMAFDGIRKKVVVFGGWDISTGGSRNDLWDWEPTTGAWTQRLTGSETGVPSPRVYASLVADDADARLELLGGQAVPGSSTGGPDAGRPILPPGMGYGVSASRELWELDPAKPAFTDRTPPLDVPTGRYGPAMAYYPVTGKTYIFGGYDSLTGQPLGDLWEWDGKVWAQLPPDVGPSPRLGAAMAYDPARKSLILYGGSDNMGTSSETWELGSTRKWTQLSPSSSPYPLYYAGMATDTSRNKILLFAGVANQLIGGPGFPYPSPMRNDVWEWDGAALTWTNRTPAASVTAPTGRSNPIMAFDEGRQKLFVYDGYMYGATLSGFWEWDPISAGWNRRDTGDALDNGYYDVAAYDSLRRREVMLTDAYSPNMGYQETWELDARAPAWYVRALPGSPGNMSGAGMVFDSARGVMVLFGSQAIYGSNASETWEYRVSSLGNGEGCTVATVASCASGNCADGVCCDVAACTGACKSCNVAGHEGTCVLAAAGTEVAGSCASGQACDGSGACKTKNGQACTSAAACASGNCVDGVCCDGTCDGACVACNLPGRAGLCTPYAAGTDPQSECGTGTGVCKSTCDGVGACAYPQTTVSCGNCLTCDGYGSCSLYDYYGCGYRVIDAGYYNPDLPPRYDAGVYPDGGGVITIDVAPILGGEVGGGRGGADGSVIGSGGTGGGRDGGTVVATGGSVTSAGGAGGSGGSGSAPLGTGGSGGRLTLPVGGGGTSGGLPGTGGAIGNRDAGSDALGTGLHKTGCSCEVGGAGQGGGLAMPIVFLGVALLLSKRRRATPPA